MALADFVVKKTTIKFDGGEFAVRGISFNDLTTVLIEEQADVEEAVALYQAGNADDPNHQQAFMSEMLGKLPRLVAKVVTMCAGEPDEWPRFLELPIPTQIEAMVAVVDLTFVEPDALKKFTAHVGHLLGKMTPKSLT